MTVVNDFGALLGALLALVVIAFVIGVIAFTIGLCMAAGRPAPKPPVSSVEQHADEIIAQLEHPHIDMRWTALDDEQVARARRTGQ